MKKILIILPRQLGDIIVSTPLASVLKSAYPEADIDWWAHPMGRSVLEGNPYLNRIFYYPLWDKKKQQANSSHIFRYFLNWLFYVWQTFLFPFIIRAQKYDLVIDSINYPRSSLQTLLTGAKKRISFQTGSIRDKVYTDLVPRSDLDKGYLGHTRLKILEPLGIRIPQEELVNIKTCLPVSEADKKVPQAWLAEHVKGIPFVVMSPTHRHPNRRWPLEKYVDLAKKLITKYNFCIVWLKAPGEEFYIEDIHTRLCSALEGLKLPLATSCYSVTPPSSFSLKQSAYVSSQAVCWVGNSNGMSHASVAAGAKTIEIHGPSHPLTWAHPDRTLHRFMWRTEGCVGCSQNTCQLPRRECLEDLDVERVFKELEDLCNLCK